MQKAAFLMEQNNEIFLSSLVSHWLVVAYVFLLDFQNLASMSNFIFVKRLPVGLFRTRNEARIISFYQQITHPCNQKIPQHLFCPHILMEIIEISKILINYEYNQRKHILTFRGLSTEEMEVICCLLPLPVNNSTALRPIDDFNK